MITAWLTVAALAAEPGYLELDLSGGASYANTIEAQPAGAIGLIAHPSPAWGVQTRIAGYVATGPLAEGSRFYMRPTRRLTRLEGSLGAALMWAPHRGRVEPYGLAGGELLMQDQVYIQEEGATLWEADMAAPPRHRLGASPVAGLGAHVWLSDTLALQVELRGGLLIKSKDYFFDSDGSRISPRAEGTLGVAFAPRRSARSGT